MKAGYNLGKHLLTRAKSTDDQIQKKPSDPIPRGVDGEAPEIKLTELQTLTLVCQTYIVTVADSMYPVACLGPV